MKRFCLILTASLYCLNILAAESSPSADFSWDAATVYFLITDRFNNGDTSNDHNYGRINDYGSERMNAATFHGGDIKGVLQKAQEGYFTALGVDVVWLTDVYEQIHGWMTGSGPVNDFPHYGYHGYYPLDYTQMDKNYGTIEEFRQLIDTLHSQGIRVMLGANLNDPGYPTLLDAVQLGFCQTGLTEAEAAEHIPRWSYDKFYADRLNWVGWYDRDWIRMPDEQWDENNPLEATLYGMPDFKDENRAPADIPSFLHEKWQREQDLNNQWVNPSAAKMRHDREVAPVEYITDWIVAWIEEFGIDGFRCDIVENVNLFRWKELYHKANLALARWRRNNAGKAGTSRTDDFYMTGDFDNAYIDYKPQYAQAGFKSMVNCNFPKSGSLEGIVTIWQEYADSLAMHPGWHSFNYLNNSYHRDANMANMKNCATTLLLSPGVAQIYYGDETGRGLSDAQYNVDSAQAFRSDMNWDSIDTDLLQHFRTLGRIRKDNPVIATGRQITISDKVCFRVNASDTIAIIVDPALGEECYIGDLWPHDSTIRDLYSGDTFTIDGGKIKVLNESHQVMILKRD